MLLLLQSDYPHVQVDDTVVLLNDDFLQIALVEITKCKR